MIIVCLLLFLALIICDTEFWYTEILCVFGVFGVVITAVILILLAGFVSKGAIIDDQIALYEETNQQIDESIREMVAQYQNYEGETFEKLKSATADTLVSLYPELKTDSLMDSRMEIYVNNQKEILELKEQKIKLRVARWWLYFGR